MDAGVVMASDVAAETRAAASLLQLAAAREGLAISAEGHLETRSEKSFNTADVFLQALEGVAEALGLEPASRAYRSEFSEHFPSFTDEDGREYSVAVLEACMSLSRSGAIWANGQKFELSCEAKDACLALRSEWETLLRTLDWLPCSAESQEAPRGLCLRRFCLRQQLNCFDEKWAGFEHAYMLEIVRVQERARCLVSMAVDFERSLFVLEQQHDGEELAEMAEYRRTICSLVACIAQLNVAANLKRQTTDELTADILEGAADVLKACAANANSPFQAVRVIAEQVVEAFEKVRSYLRELLVMDEAVNPNLSQNAALVELLVRWEESWIIGARYIQTRPVLEAVCRLVPELREAQRSSPALAQMCANFDAELFMVLPRLVWLCFLGAEGGGQLAELVANLLPHRFVQVPMRTTVYRPAAGGLQLQRFRRQRSEPNLGSLAGPSTVSDLTVLGAGSELKALREKFRKVIRSLEEAPRQTEGNREAAETTASAPAWEVLVHRAVSGSSGGCCGGSAAAGKDLASMEQRGPPAAEAAAALEEFMHDLEAWSMELQRHSPEDWNECVNVLVRCSCCCAEGAELEA
jgi:hypothetical protein